MIYPPESNPKPACLRMTAYSTGGSKAKQMPMLYRKTFTASKIVKRSGRWCLIQTNVRLFESLPRKIPLYTHTRSVKLRSTDQAKYLGVAITPDYTPGIYAEGYIVFVFPFVCSFVRLFVRSFVRSYFLPSRGICVKVLR